MWRPIDERALRDDIAASELRMDPPVRRLWNLVRIEPAKWRQHPWGNEGGGFWVVGLIGRYVLWYNDIEGGFNVSRYTTLGTIDEYQCNQDDLWAALAQLWWELETGEAAARFGGPQPTPRGGVGGDGRS